MRMSAEPWVVCDVFTFFESSLGKVKPWKSNTNNSLYYSSMVPSFVIMRYVKQILCWRRAEEFSPTIHQPPQKGPS